MGGGLSVGIYQADRNEEKIFYTELVVLIIFTNSFLAKKSILIIVNWIMILKYTLQDQKRGWLSHHAQMEREGFNQ